MSTSAVAQLPGPVGDPDRLLTLARLLASVSADAGGTSLARTGSAVALPASWSGVAADAARAEAGALAAHIRRLADSLAPLARILLGYAGALTQARQSVALLRHEWDAADREHRERRNRAAAAASVDLAAGLSDAAAADRDWAHEQARLLARHTRVMSDLADAGRHAAAAIHVTTGSTFGDPGSARARLLATLPLTEDTAASAAATATVTRWLQGRPAPSWWTPADLAGLADLDLTDPHIAQALLSAIGPGGLRAVVGGLLHRTSGAARGRSAATDEDGDVRAADTALRALATAYSAALSCPGAPGSAVALRAATWRAAWSAGVAREGREPSGAPEVRPLRDVHAAAALLRIGHEMGLSAPADDALAALVPAIIHAEPLDQASVWREDPRTDAVAALLDLARDRPDTAATLLGTPLGTYAFLDYLVVTRPDAVTEGPSGSVAYVADVMAAILPCAPISVTSHLLDAIATRVGTAQAQVGPRLSLVDSLAPWRALVAQLMREHPDSTNAALFAPASARDLDSEGWSATGLPRIRLRDELSAARLWGLIGLPSDPDALTREVGTASGVEFDRAVQALCADDLAQALDTVTSDPQATQAALTRLGTLVGFTTAATADLLVHAATSQDAVNGTARKGVDAMLDSLKVPAGVKTGVPSALASLALVLVTQVAQSRMAQLAPTSAGAAAQASRDQARVELRSSSRALVWDLISQAGAWRPEDNPRDWIARHHAPDFLDANGHPRPWSALTRAQQDAYAAWSQTVPLYATLPSYLEQAIDEGRRRADDLIKT